MRVRIIEKGWESFSDNFGGIDFIDGLSVRDDIATPIFDRIACSIHCVNEDTGKQVGIQQRMIDGHHQEIGNPLVVEALRGEAMKVEAQAKAAPAEERPGEAPLVFYTADELEAIIDKGGINGLREIGTPLQVKGRSIPELMNAILRAQDLLRPAPAAPAFVAE